MSITVRDENTLTADGSEQSLGGPFTASGTYVLTVGTFNMADLDIVTLRAYVKILTGDSVKYRIYYARLSNKQGDGADVGSSAQGDVVAVSIPIESPYEIEFTLKQEAGTNRDFPWRVDTL